MEDLRRVPWRVGRSLGRTLYARTGGDDWLADTFVGVMDTPELAAFVVNAVNALVTQGGEE